MLSQAWALAVSFILVPLPPQMTYADETFRQLNGEQIKAMFVGMEFTDTFHWADVYGGDGHITSYYLEKKGDGTWRVENDQLCITLNNDERCYLVWLSGATIELRDVDGTGQTIDGVLQRPSKRN